MNIRNFTYLEDVIITAIEAGAVDYWGQIKNYHWMKAPAGVMVREDLRIGLGHNEWVNVTPEVIKAAMDKIISGEVETNKYIIGACAAAVATKDSTDIDSEIADVIIQVAILGEVKYA